MYIVTINNNGVIAELHGYRYKLASGNVAKGINSIDSFTCTITPENPIFNKLNEFTTLVSVFNTSKNRYEFFGRLLYSSPSMSESGMIGKELTFESYMGFLCDSVQNYVEEQNWTVAGLLNHIINVHNSQVEDYKKIIVGNVTAKATNDNIYIGIQRKNSFDTIKEKLIDKIGGELVLRVKDNKIYLDYLEQIGEVKSTEIALSKNMKAITQEKNPSEYITRLIPLGYKLSRDETITDDEGNTSVETIETEERLDITSVNDGLNYIDDEEAIKRYGVHVGVVEFDDITDPSNLLARGKQWLAENNKVKIKYSINALDLSLLDLDYDDLDVGNYYPIKNSLLGIDDLARLIKKNINIVEEVKSTIEVGENSKTLNDLVVENAKANNDYLKEIGEIKSNYVTNQKLTNSTSKMTSSIEQSVDSVLLTVSENYTKVEDNDEFKKSVNTQLSVLQGEVVVNFETTEKQIEEVNGDLQTRFQEINKYIRFQDGNIILGEEGNELVLKIQNDRISFLQNDLEVAYFSNRKLFVLDGEFIESLTIGKFAFLPRSNGNLSFKMIK